VKKKETVFTVKMRQANLLKAKAKLIQGELIQIIILKALKQKEAE
jgi:hypothetical protein